MQKIQLISTDKALCEAWAKYFEKDIENISIFQDEYFSQSVDCVTSPANSFGFMDGGLDIVIKNKIGNNIQQKAQKIIKEKYYGELLVGQVELIETGNEEIPYLMLAPTMRVPMIIGPETVVPYLVSRAIFICLINNPQIETITICGLGTGVGKIPVDICAKQMKEAYDDFYLGKFQFPVNWYIAQGMHQSLYTNQSRDLQHAVSNLL